MSERVSVEVSADGRAVAVKRSHEDKERARLRHEAEMLDAARHPGVVELLGINDTDTETTLTTFWLGGGSIADVPAPPKRLASLGASLATTVADLHDRGVAHGRVTADHVLLDGLGRVVLVGFADATRGEAEPPADDVAGIGEILANKLPDDASPPRLRPIGADRDTIDRLRAVVERATDPAPSHRPSARALASLLAEIAGEPTSRGPIRLPRPLTTPAPPARVRLVPAVVARVGRRAAVRVVTGTALIAVVATAGLAAHTAFASSAPSRDQPAPIALVETSAPTSTSASTSAATPTATSIQPRVWPTSIPCPAPIGSGERHDVDGDGCPEAVTIERGAIVVDEQRFELGDAGDAIAVADWDCDGLDTAALLRPDTGEIFVFDEWASAGVSVTARLVARQADTASLAPPDGHCGSLTLVDRDGNRSAVPLEGGAG